MRIIRLPGIHHDANCVVFSGSDSNVLVDAGTTWYQMLQVERISGHLNKSEETNQSLDRILLTCRRYPFAGGAKHISEENGKVPIHIHQDAISVLETGDFYSTWANRYDSDMPSTECEPISQGDSFDLGDGEIVAISLPGHCSDGMGYFEKERGVLVSGPVLPRADSPSRWDMPVEACLNWFLHLETIIDLSPKKYSSCERPHNQGL